MLLVTGSAQVIINLNRERILLHNTSWALFAFTAHAHPRYISDGLPSLLLQSKNCHLAAVYLHTMSEVAV